MLSLLQCISYCLLFSCPIFFPPTTPQLRNNKTRIQEYDSWSTWRRGDCCWLVNHDVLVVVCVTFPPSVCCRVLHCTMVESYWLFGIFGAYKVFNGMLLTLQALHIFWFYLILRMLHQYVIHGQVRQGGSPTSTPPKTIPRNNNKMFHICAPTLVLFPF